MSGVLLTLGRNGALAARAALELTGQNVAQAGNSDYTRRSAQLGEVAVSGGIGLGTPAMPGGVRIVGIARAEATFLRAEARRTGGDLARADAELAGLRQAESVLDTADIYGGMTGFEAGLLRLAADPLAGALRTDVLERARGLAANLNVAAQGLAAAGGEIRNAASAGVADVNRAAAELARLNGRIARIPAGSGAKAALLDRRDVLADRLTRGTGASAAFDGAGRATLRIGGAVLVGGGEAATLSMDEAPPGTLSFALGGAPVALGAGALAGHGQALQQTAAAGDELDRLAATLMTLGNDAQAAGATPSGTGGPPLFTGTGAADIALALSDPRHLATAPAGSAPGSRDGGNLDALRRALADGGPAADADRLLTTLAGALAGRAVTHGVLATFATEAAGALTAATAVDLDAEAANLLRFQQAFQASGRVLQTAADLFDTMLGIGR